MARTNIDIDDELIAGVMRRYRLATKREAVDFALRQLSIAPMSVHEMLAMRGSGWDEDLDALRQAEADEGFDAWQTV